MQAGLNLRGVKLCCTLITECSAIRPESDDHIWLLLAPGPRYVWIPGYHRWSGALNGFSAAKRRRWHMPTVVLPTARKSLS